MSVTKCSPVDKYIKYCNNNEYITKVINAHYYTTPYYTEFINVNIYIIDSINNALKDMKANGFNNKNSCNEYVSNLSSIIINILDITQYTKTKYLDVGCSEVSLESDHPVIGMSNAYRKLIDNNPWLLEIKKPDFKYIHNLLSSSSGKNKSYIALTDLNFINNDEKYMFSLKSTDCDVNGGTMSNLSYVNSDYLEDISPAAYEITEVLLKPQCFVNILYNMHILSKVMVYDLYIDFNERPRLLDNVPLAAYDIMFTSIEEFIEDINIDKLTKKDKEYIIDKLTKDERNTYWRNTNILNLTEYLLYRYLRNCRYVVKMMKL